MAAIFADVELVPAALVTVGVGQTVDFSLVRFEATPLGEGLLAVFAFERTNACR